jgi:hypothetical protein
MKKFLKHMIITGREDNQKKEDNFKNQYKSAKINNKTMNDERK